MKRDNQNGWVGGGVVVVNGCGCLMHATCWCRLSLADARCCLLLPKGSLRIVAFRCPLVQHVAACSLMLPATICCCLLPLAAAICSYLLATICCCLLLPATCCLLLPAACCYCCSWCFHSFGAAMVHMVLVQRIQNLPSCLRDEFLGVACMVAATRRPPRCHCLHKSIVNNFCV